MLDSNGPATSPNTALTFIFITILIDVIGIGIIIPVLPALIKTLTGGDLADAALYGGLLIISFSTMQFLFAPVVGELSDRYGRRPVLLISLFVLGIDYFFHAFAPTIALLFVGRILAGITGASFSVATSYIADVSTPQNKAKNFGLIGAAFGIGFILGPVIGGVCAKWGTQMPFIVAGIFTLLNFLFGYFFVPESLPLEKRRPVRYTNMIPGVSLAHIGKYKTLLGLVIAFVLVNLAGQVMPSTWSFFTLELFKWDETEVGISLAVVGALVVIVQAVLIGWFVKRLGNKRVILLGFLLWTLGMVSFCFAVTPVILYLALIPYCLGGIAGPSIQGILSNSVSEKEQGNLNGALTQAVSLTAIAGPLLYTTLFSRFSQSDAAVYFPGAPYLAAAGILIIACIIAFVSLRNYTEPERPVTVELNPVESAEPVEVN
ncbi:MAG: TCR/Tet family MFS transporter [Bacteroidetes bacterium]|nr:TCR/Tet family MFS transporter [Bacteroidota bacterium]